VGVWLSTVDCPWVLFNDQNVATMMLVVLLLLMVVSCTAFAPTPSSIHRRGLYAVDVEAASIKLLWETLEELQARPVLNLSLREESPEEECRPDTSGWDGGQRWKETEQGLKNIGLKTDILGRCPQLYRLETIMVLEAAEWLIQQGFTTVIQSDPRILSYKCKDIEYGLEFLKMMGMSSPLLLPALLLSGVEGGLQERAAQAALGAAGDATYNANQRIVGDVAAALNEIKKNGKKGL